jgi:hypothetical protein
MFLAIRRESCYTRTYIVDADSKEDAVHVANTRWHYRNLDGEAFVANDFKDIGTAFETSECAIPDH